MAKLKKRKKSSRSRGSGTHGGGSRKKNRGKGHKGGKGMSGSGKRADQKKTYIFRYKHPYFGRAGRERFRKKRDKINVGDIEKNLENFMDRGKAERGKNGITLELEDYKILGSGEINSGVIVKAKSFSKQAKQKIEEAGGKAIELEENSDGERSKSDSGKKSQKKKSGKNKE